VDDIIITGSSTHAIKSLISHLSSRFALKDLGPLHYFLGIEVSKVADGSFHLSQTNYINDLLRRTDMTTAKAQPTPMLSTLRLQQDGSTAVSDATLYRSVVGALQYILITRPDLSYAVNKTCQFMHNPQDHHWKAVKRILCYLAGTTNHGLLIKRNSHSSILGFVDADWGHRSG